jgi:hypothetical protein
MKKTLLVLLTFVCANVALAQQHHFDLDHTAGDKLSVAEKQSIQQLITDIFEMNAKHKKTELEKYAQDIERHIDRNTQSATNIQNLDYTKLQEYTQHMSQAMETMSAMVKKMMDQKSGIIRRLGDAVTLTFQGKRHETLTVELAMNAHSGDYMIRSIKEH